jgi:apoptosis-inducing factor 3
VAVTLKSGVRLEADIVVIGAGVRPTTDFLQGALPLERDGSLRVTKELAVEGQSDIYAAGALPRARLSVCVCVRACGAVHRC